MNTREPAVVPAMARDLRKRSTRATTEAGMKLSLLVAERGSRWLERLRGWRNPLNHLIVLTQHGSESIQEFRARVQERLEKLKRKRTQVDQMLLAAGSSDDGSALLARAQMLSSMAAAVGDDVPIVIDAGSERDARQRLRLQALAQAVAEQLAWPSHRIRLA
jgi:hypothetical protein